MNVKSHNFLSNDHLKLLFACTPSLRLTNISLLFMTWTVLCLRLKILFWKNFRPFFLSPVTYDSMQNRPMHFCLPFTGSAPLSHPDASQPRRGSRADRSSRSQAHSDDAWSANGAPGHRRSCTRTGATADAPRHVPSKLDGEGCCGRKGAP